MSDLISRQAAIDIVRNITVKEVTPAYMLIDKAEVLTELMMMPPAEPELAQDLHNACIDAISRQAAIELIENESRKWGDEYGVSDVLCDLADLPSAQPEKHTEERTKTRACDLIDRQMLKADLLCGDNAEHDYCFPCKKILERIDNQPPAQPERKRGFWWAIEKGEKGYSAGNFRCSVCGEPNVSYISKPNFCPNCGADMRGEQDE